MADRTSRNGIAYHTEGPDDGEWVALSNSLLTDRRMWDHLAARLAGSYRVLRYDQRGHGRTPAASEPCDFASLATDLIDVLDDAEVPAAHLVGLSMGGNTVAAVAVAHPERALSVTMCDCRPRSDAAAAAAWRARVAAARVEGVAAVVEDSVVRWFPQGMANASANRALVRSMSAALTAEGYESCVAAIREHNSFDTWTAIRTPVLLMAGDGDGDLPAVYEALVGELPDAETATVPDAGHISALDNPAAFANLVEQFIARHARAVGPPGPGG